MLAEFLPAADRALLRAHYDQGRTLVELAALLGAEPRALSRRVRRLLTRLANPAFALAALHAPEWAAQGGYWRDLARVARACVLEGHTLRSAAKSLNMSIHAVRRHRGAVLAMAQGAKVIASDMHSQGGGSWGGGTWRGTSIGASSHTSGRAGGSSARWRHSA